MKNIMHLYLLMCILAISQFTFAKNLSSKEVMFIVHTETQGSKGVYPIYQEMKKIGHNIKVVAIPLYNGWYHLPIDKEFMENFDKEDVIYPCGVDEPYTKCSGIESYKPDYLFVQNPYNTSW